MTAHADPSIAPDVEWRKIREWTPSSFKVGDLVWAKRRRSRWEIWRERITTLRWNVPQEKMVLHRITVGVTGGEDD